MTQENAADRAQKINELDEATDAVESFAQDWLATEEFENAELATAASSSRVVATLPDWSTFASATGTRREGGIWREFWLRGRLKTTGVALAAFGLGVLCASDGWRNGEKEADAPAFAAVDAEKDLENRTTFETLEEGASVVALAPIDSSTLRSIPNVDNVGFETQPTPATLNGALSVNWGNDGASAENVGWGDLNGRNGGDASGNLGANGAMATLGAADDSNWRRGVDFEREVETPASSDRFPTWEDLATNASGNVVENAAFAPGSTVANNAPVANNVPVASGYPVANNVSVASGYPVANNVPVASGYPVANNAPVASGYPVANNVPVASDYPVANNAPVAPALSDDVNGNVVSNNQYSSGNVEATRNTRALVAPNAETNAGYTAYNDGAGYQRNNGANLNGGAPQFAGNSQNSGYNQANGSENFAGWPTATPNLASSTATATAPATVEPPRAMVAQITSENATVATPNVPSANQNLRW